jgi:hypothetical protein
MRAWNLSFDEKTGKILDSNGKSEFKIQPLREFLCPLVEKKRKADFSLAMAEFLTPDSKSTGSQEVETAEQRTAKIHAWLTKTTNNVNPLQHGHCILCLLETRSELTTHFSGASIITNPNVCVLIQHHKNVFGEEGEYKPGNEIHRGSNLCGLVGTVLEYRADNYLPATACVEYSTIEVAPTTSRTNSRAHRSDSGLFLPDYQKVDRKQLVLQWVESEAIVFKASDVLHSPKNCA